MRVFVRWTPGRASGWVAPKNRPGSVEKAGGPRESTPRTPTNEVRSGDRVHDACGDTERARPPGGSSVDANDARVGESLPVGELDSPLPVEQPDVRLPLEAHEAPLAKV